MSKGDKNFICRRAYSKATVFRDKDSEVHLDVPDGARGIVMGYTHTSFISFADHVPGTECFVSPIPEYHFIPDDNQKETSEIWFKIHIPHRIKNPDHLKAIRVRHGDIHGDAPFQFVPLTGDGPELNCFYEVQTSHIVIHTKHFTQFVCTSCKEVCTGYLKTLVYGSMKPFNNQYITELRFHIACSLYDIDDFRMVHFN